MSDLTTWSDDELEEAHELCKRKLSDPFRYLQMNEADDDGNFHDISSVRAPHIDKIRQVWFDVILGYLKEVEAEQKRRRMIKNE